MRARLAVALAALCALSACGHANPEPIDDEAEGAARPADAVVLERGGAAGLVLTIAERTEAPAEIVAIGRVLDPSPLVDVAAALASARVAADAAARDLARTETLARDQANASEREVAAARLADAQARGALAQARARALASFGSADFGRVARLAAPLARGELALARIELPAGAALPGERDEVRVAAPALGIAELRARVIGPAGALDPSLQGPALIVAISPSPPPAGAVLEARVALGVAQSGVWLPESAVLWSDGAPLAFVATGADAFARRALTLARPLRDGYLVTAGVSAGERVVTGGAEQLLSAQRVGSGEPEED